MKKLLGAPDTWESGINSTGLSQACRFVVWDGMGCPNVYIAGVQNIVSI